MTTINIDVLNVILTEFFIHQLSLKMQHFQTKSYGAHKATDQYLITFNLNLDRFMEVAQGLTDQRVSTTGDIRPITFNSDEEFGYYLKAFTKFLDEDIPKYCGTNPDLLAIRDEMLADLNQLKYLLTFK